MEIEEGVLVPLPDDGILVCRLCLIGSVTGGAFVEGEEVLKKIEFVAGIEVDIYCVPLNPPLITLVHISRYPAMKRHCRWFVRSVLTVCNSHMVSRNRLNSLKSSCGRLETIRKVLPLVLWPVMRCTYIAMPVTDSSTT